jgi:hypothetical protein
MPKTSPDEAERLLQSFFRKAGKVSVQTRKRPKRFRTMPQGIEVKERMGPSDTDAFPNLKKGRFS